MGSPASSSLILRDNSADSPVFEVRVERVDGQPWSRWFNKSYIGRLNPTPGTKALFEGTIQDVRISTSPASRDN